MQFVDQPREPGIAGAASRQRTEPGEQPARLHLPVDDDLAGHGFEERPAQEVRGPVGRAVEVREQFPGRLVAAEHVVVVGDEVGRLRLEQPRYGRDLRGEGLVVDGMGCRCVTGEPEEVVTFVAAEPQDRGQGAQHLLRDADVPSLLQIRVPGGADPGEQRQFLPAQPGGAAPAGVRQPHLVGGDLLPAAAQEQAQFTTLVFGVLHESVPPLVPE